MEERLRQSLGEPPEVNYTFVEEVINERFQGITYVGKLQKPSNMPGQIDARRPGGDFVRGLHCNVLKIFVARICLCVGSGTYISPLVDELEHV